MGMLIGRRSGGEAPARRGIRVSPRLVLGAIIAIISLVSYYGYSSLNPVTGRKQHISMSSREEVAIGLQSAPAMAQQFGGLSADAEARARVDRIGRTIVAAIPHELVDDEYQFNFHLLADRQTVNAFALPGGQIFITEALYSRLETPGQLAGVLGHEIGHVLGRHSAEQMAKARLAQGLSAGAGVAGSDYGVNAGQVAQAVSQFTLLRYGREHEIESDALGVRFMAAAGFDPRSMIEVMHILEQASGGGGRQPEFSSTHPNPGRRREELEALIRKMWPNGLPEGLTK